MTLEIGQPFELAIWLTGEEREEHVKHFIEIQMPYEFKMAELKFNVELSKPTITFKLPGEDRVPQVPDHIHGINVRLLVVEAHVIAQKKHQMPTLSAFTLDMPPKDLDQLRRITRRAYRKHTGINLNNKQCDQVIEYLGPETALKTLQREHNQAIH